MADEFSGNGHGSPDAIGEVVEEAQNNAFKGGEQTLDRNRRVIQMENRQYASVLQQSMHSSIKDDAELLSELKTANWDSVEDYQTWCNAYDECKRYGAPTDWLIRRLSAKAAGLNGGRLQAILDTISHTTFTTNYMNPKSGGLSRFFRGRDNGSNRNQSPIPE